MKTVGTIATEKILTRHIFEDCHAALAKFCAPFEIGIRNINSSYTKPNTFISDYVFSHEHMDYHYPTKYSTNYILHITAKSIVTGLLYRAVSLSRP